MANKSVKPKKTCVKCNRNLVIDLNFYKCDSPLFPDGYFHLCRKCLISMIENRDNGYEVALMALHAMDKPMLVNLWDDANVGNYFRQINSLPNYRGMTWDNSNISNMSTEKVGKTNNSDDDFEDEIPSGDKKYSKKWMGYYFDSEIEYLEDYLEGLNRDFRVLTKSHQDYAKKIAKASLHMDKCFQDMQDGAKGSEKRYKEAKEVFDTLSKSAQFSEDRRGQNDVALGSFSQITEMVENNTYVYEHKNDLDKDNYDKLIEDFSHIGKSI